ncbi:LPS-assembly protein LptD [Polymorphobacter glacialis]|uniref:LPS-assembly protein LptD n=1 Tax=Sandarakinorhabdus glacialis TaxID=1614636 RepID=A0A917E632_9SPHN|nr:LPS assembly protein LptD [Polymorphobacter glacialis]GGE06663.1 LPS-assembly protein LptD [Polymorphobacter glacialis]
MRYLLLTTATLLAAGSDGAAFAQAATPAPAPAAAGQESPATTIPRDGGAIVEAGDAIDFEADAMQYDDRQEVVTATGNVRLSRDAWKLSAQNIEYNRKTGVVVATGNVVSVDPQGNQAFGDRVELTDSLRDGAIDNILLVLNDGGRLAANQGQRSDDIITLDRAVYSPCAVVDSEGCPHAPVWQVKGVRISYNRAKHRLYYRNASLEIFGVPVFYLPKFSHPDGEAKQVSGLLLPGIEFQRQLGVGISLPYHFALAPDRDITVAPHFYTGANPAMEVQARRLLRDGPVQMDAFFTYAQLTDFADDGVTEIDRGNRLRGYFALKGRLQHTPEWRSSFSVRLTTDDTFNRRYGLDFDDTLRSTYALERQTPTSFLSISAWAFQGLRITDLTGEIPFVLPLVDYDWRPTETVLGGRFRFGANTMNLFRTDGQSVQRALMFGRWDRSLITTWGQRITATGMMRSDIYNVIDPERATLPQYAGREGIQGRIAPVAAVDVEWPFAGPAFGGTQTFTPRVQFVAAPANLNSGIPNEDSRAIELEDISLFDLNRFPGYDRVEGGTRMTYGLEYTLDRQGVALRTEIGQSVRLAGSGDEFPRGTGLSDTVSDFVGRTNLKLGRLFEVTHRFRVDRNSFTVRRNEIDVSIGNRTTYASIGYIRLNRQIELEDLEDREELRVGGRAVFAKFWSVFGSAIVDLTSRTENPLAGGDGFKPTRHRAGVEYEDECFRLGVSWRRDYIGDRDFRAGNTFLLTLAFKTLGR